MPFVPELDAQANLESEARDWIEAAKVSPVIRQFFVQRSEAQGFEPFHTFTYAICGTRVPTFAECGIQQVFDHRRIDGGKGDDGRHGSRGLGPRDRRVDQFQLSPVLA